MEDLDKLVQATMAEIERLLSTKQVVGEPITIDGNTIVPLVSIGFGFGAGNAIGRLEKERKEPRGGGGTGGGGGVRPMAVVIVNQEGVRVAPIASGGTATAIEKVGDIIGKSLERRTEKKQEAQQ